MAELLFSELCDGEVKGGVSGPRSRQKLARVRLGRWKDGRDRDNALPFCAPSPSESEVEVGETLLPLFTIAGGGGRRLFCVFTRSVLRAGIFGCCIGWGSESPVSIMSVVGVPMVIGACDSATNASSSSSSITSK